MICATTHASQGHDSNAINNENILLVCTKDIFVATCFDTAFRISPRRHILCCAWPRASLIGQFELFLKSESGTTTVQNEEHVPCHLETTMTKLYSLHSQFSEKNSFVRPLAKI